MELRSFLYGIGTCLAVMAVAGGACMTVSRMESSEMLDQVESPDGRWTATRYIVMSGGAPGWCSQRVDVHPTAIAFDLEKAIDDFQPVSTTGCSVDLALTWEGDARLEVAYPLHPDGVTVYQRPFTEDRSVQLSFRILEPAQ